MMIATENLQKVKNVFEYKVQNENLKIDVDYPFYNVYEWGNELFFSNGYKEYKEACEFACQEFYAEIPKTWNAAQNKVRWIGALNGSKVVIDKDY